MLLLTVSGRGLSAHVLWGCAQLATRTLAKLRGRLLGPRREAGPQPGALVLAETPVSRGVQGPQSHGLE